MSDTNVTMSMEQLEAVVAKAVQAALESQKPKASAKIVDPVKAAKAEAYLQSKKDVALRYARDKGQHYYVCRKPHSRRLLVWGESTRADAKRRGQNPDHSLGVPVWSTYEGGFRLYMAK